MDSVLRRRATAVCRMMKIVLTKASHISDAHTQSPPSLTLHVAAFQGDFKNLERHTLWSRSTSDEEETGTGLVSPHPGHCAQARET